MGEKRGREAWREKGRGRGDEGDVRSLQRCEVTPGRRVEDQVM